ncbi:MAG: hypothetical protein HC877_00885 [Thioploca sp.]|nr:hypothetical protein [Thioploca sp.]
MSNNNSLFELRISSLRNAAEISQQWATHTISILDTELTKTIFATRIFYESYEALIPKPRDQLSLHQCYFDDITPEDNFGLILPTLVDMQAILAFSADLTSHDKLLIHCSAGISRSTAVATGVLCQHGLSPIAALGKVFSIRKIAAPNSYIIALMDEALQLDGELNEALLSYS